jgi:hypothetical protein
MKESIMDNRVDVLLVVLFLTGLSMLAVSTSCASPQPKTTMNANIQWNRLSSWLPEDTETLWVGHHLFLERTTVDPRPNQVFEDVVLRLARAVGQGALLNQLAGRQVRVAVEGGRRFRPPSELGSMAFQGCLIMAVDEPISQDALTFPKTMARRTLVMEHPTWVFEQRHEKDAWTFHVVTPEPHLLMVSTDADYLRETLRRMEDTPSSKSFFEGLPETSHVERDAPVWAIRHYRVSSESSDPTSFLGGLDGEAIGLAMTVNPNDHTLEIAYLSANLFALTLSQSWFDAAVPVPLISITQEDRVVRARFDLRTLHTEPSAVAGLLFLFGVAGYV